MFYIYLVKQRGSLYIFNFNFFNCTLADRASDSMMARPKAIHFSWLGSELFVCCLVHRGSTDDLLLLQISSGDV